MNNYKNARVKRYCPVAGSGIAITAWTVISSSSSNQPQKPTQVLVARGSLTYLVDGSECTQVCPEFSSAAGTNASITCVAASLNGLHIAMLTDSGVLWLGSSDLENKYCEHAAGLRTKPRQMVW